MAEFFKEDLSGARFEQVNFSGAWFRNVYFTGVTARGAWLEDVDIDGEIRNVRINGVDIGPLVEAELSWRCPERTRLDPADADGFREAWAIIERVWPPTVERAAEGRPDSAVALSYAITKCDSGAALHHAVSTLDDSAERDNPRNHRWPSPAARRRSACDGSVQAMGVSQAEPRCATFAQATRHARTRSVPLMAARHRLHRLARRRVNPR